MRFVVAYVVYVGLSPSSSRGCSATTASSKAAVAAEEEEEEEAGAPCSSPRGEKDFIRGGKDYDDGDDQRVY